MDSSDERHGASSKDGEKYWMRWRREEQKPLAEWSSRCVLKTCYELLYICWSQFHMPGVICNMWYVIFMYFWTFHWSPPPFFFCHKVILCRKMCVCEIFILMSATLHLSENYKDTEPKPDQTLLCMAKINKMHQIHTPAVCNTHMKEL